MSLRSEIQEQINVLQGKLAIMNRVPEDTFNLGTIALFSSQSGVKWYYVKKAEETWHGIGGSDEKSLVEWVLHSEASGVGYFEVYIMVASPSPIYTTS